MKWYSPRFPRSADWQGTVANIGTLLSKKKFVTDETVEFTDFVPTLTGLTMPISAIRIFTARYSKLGKLLFLVYDIQFTVAPVLTGIFYISVPPEMRARQYQSGVCQLYPVLGGIVNQLGMWDFRPFDNMLQVSTSEGVAFPAGAIVFRMNSFVEVE